MSTPKRQRVGWTRRQRDIVNREKERAIVKRNGGYEVPRGKMQHLRLVLSGKGVAETFQLLFLTGHKRHPDRIVTGSIVSRLVGPMGIPFTTVSPMCGCLPSVSTIQVAFFLFSQIQKTKSRAGAFPRACHVSPDRKWRCGVSSHVKIRLPSIRVPFFRSKIG